MYNFKYVTKCFFETRKQTQKSRIFRNIVKVFRYFNIAYRYKYPKKIIDFEEVLCAKN